MARGSRSSGSYREWEAARRAEERAAEQAARLEEQRRKARERERAVAEAAARDRKAAARTLAVDQRIAELEGLLRSSLARDPRISLASLRRRAAVPPLDLGQLGIPLRAPEWEDFESEPERGLRRMFGGQQRYEAAVDAAERQFSRAQEDYWQQEAERRRQVTQARRVHEQRVAEEEHEVAVHNARVDEMAAGLAANDRFAVSEYVQSVLDASPYPTDFPAERSAGYVPESSLLAVEWYLPPVEVIPVQKAFRHVKSRKVVEPVARPVAEIRQIYQGVTGQKIQPHLITLRATREQFTPLILDEPKFKPVDCVRRYFFADISPHPEELIPVEPVMPYSMADPRVIDPVDVISDIDKRPNLLELSPKEFEQFIQNLFAKLGFDTRLYRASGDGGIDCVAYDPHPITGGKFIVQAKLYTRTVQPTHVRDLWGTVQHEGATKGIMITTSGYGPDSYKFAGGKPLNLIDGSGLLSLCQQNAIPARILNRGKSTRDP